MDEHLQKVLALAQKEISEQDREEVVKRLCKVVKKLYQVETDSKVVIEKLNKENQSLKDDVNGLEERRRIEGQIITILTNENEELKKELKSFHENRWRNILKMTKELATSSCSSMVIYAYQTTDSGVRRVSVHGARLLSVLPQSLQDMLTFTHQVDKLRSQLDSWLGLDESNSLKDLTACEAEFGFQVWKPNECPASPAQSNCLLDLD
eukprot:GFUD01032146.1.p1 GENE.GFUD01032146.1~~GFUD01032146.1.p1  ORF type:complete len:208 (-),score=45.41 GFUD01032146.1:205-828(-)